MRAVVLDRNGSPDRDMRLTEIPRQMPRAGEVAVRVAAVSLNSWDVDLAVVTGQDTPRGLEERHLFDQPFAWVGPRRRRGERATLTERLRREPILRLAAESRGRAVLDRYLADARIRPVSTIDVPSVSLLLSYVSGGLGIGLVPALALKEAPGDRVVSEPARVPPLPVTLVWRAAAHRQPTIIFRAGEATILPYRSSDSSSASRLK